MTTDSTIQISSERPVLVTGASGFVCSHTARLLVKAGRKVRVFLRKTSNPESLQGLPVEKHYGDALDPMSLSNAWKGAVRYFTESSTRAFI